MKFKLAISLVLAFPLAMFSQEFRGTISGLVTDPLNAAIPGANVAVTETHTGTKIRTVSEASGQYTAPFLLPGDYDITARMEGFKEFVRKGIHVGAGDHIVIDIPLQVGDVTQSVEVTAEAPLVNRENASVGQAISTKEVEDLPTNGRSPMMAAQLALGVVYSPFNSTSTVQQTYDSSNNFSIGGTPTQTSEILLDGAPNATWDMRSAFTPPMDAVQEVRVKTFDSDTAFGHTGGGTINMVLKSGSNSLHGTLYEFTQPSNLTANNFFNNKNGLGNPLTHFNQYGLTAGGPVRIPRVFNGKDKLFWFFAWENNRNSTPVNNFFSVPTPAEKRGDFSQILAADGTQLYNPYSGVQTGNVINRAPYPGNQIPHDQFNPIAVAYMKFFPDPNVSILNSTSKADGYDNFGTNATNTNIADSELGRLDYNMSQKSRMFFDVRHNSLAAGNNNYFKNISTGTITGRENWGASLDEVYILNPSNVLNVRLNYTFMFENSSEPSAGFDPTTLGFPAYMKSLSERLQMPNVSFGTVTNIPTLGDTFAARRPSQTMQLFASWTKIKGNHTLKFGGDLRQSRLSTITYANSAGSFNFAGNTWVRASSSSSATIAQGQDIASFLLGLPYQGFYDINTYGSWYSYYESGFVQDDWRMTRNLTVNVGVRFDHDGGYHEKYGRTVNGFAANTPNPIAAAAIANYAAKPSTLIPFDQFKVLGGLTYPANGDTAVYHNTSHLTSPRIGIAWSPEKLGGRTVLRAGFGMFVQPANIAYLAQNGNWSSNPLIDQEGFSQQTSMTITTNNYLAPTAATLSDPFPGGAILQPMGSSLGLKTFLGQNVSFLNPRMKSPYSMRWNFGFQHSLSPNTLLEVVYIGNHAVHTPINLTQLNGIPRQYLSTLPVRDTPLITALNGSVPDPFFGVIPAGTPSGATISGAQLLSRYPEFPLGYTNGGFTGSGGVLEQNLNVGSSYFHSLNVRFQRRLSRGLMVTFNYIFSKLMEEDTWLNDTDPRPEKRIGVFDHTHRGVLAVNYQLPIGSGQAIHFGSRLANSLLGGWNLNAIYTRQTGQPFTWIQTSSTTVGDYVYFGQKLIFDPRQTNTVAFNTSAFDTIPADQFAYHIRTFSTTFSSLRGDGMNEVNSSMLKRFDIGEKRYFQLRFEVFNVMNHPTFRFPNLGVTTTAFGTITAQGNRPRQIQVGGRFVF